MTSDNNVFLHSREHLLEDILKISMFFASRMSESQHISQNQTVDNEAQPTLCCSLRLGNPGCG